MWLERTTYTTAYKLPGILRWFEVKSVSTVEISPLDYAIETMQSANDKISSVVQRHLTVMGGFANYEKAFFIEQYMQEHPDDLEKIGKLKDLIAWQIPHLVEGVRIHGEKVTEALRPFHDRLEACFKQLREKVEKQYGVRHLPPANERRRGSRPLSIVRSFTMPSSQPGSDGFTLEPLLPKKLHSKSQDKLDREEPERDRKDKKKEKRNSKHQEVFDKELKASEIPVQAAEAVILSETISPLRPQRPKSQILSQLTGDRRLSVSPGPPSASSNSSGSPGPPPITPRTKLSFSLLTGSSKETLHPLPGQKRCPTPLPVKSSTADYGNLFENSDLSPSTPPPPPPHQRVGAVIKTGDGGA
uniref:DOCKER domain-containing protein n=1 Tax=Neogobius melanostomus TaxID=47308 RepID=A0A8C6UJN5_9GOBI